MKTKPPSVLSVEGKKAHTGHALWAHIKGILHQEPHVKSEDLLWRNSQFQKNAYLFRNYSPILCKKTLYPGPHLALITLPLNVN